MLLFLNEPDIPFTLSIRGTFGSVGAIWEAVAVVRPKYRNTNPNYGNRGLSESEMKVRRLTRLLEAPKS